MSTRYHVLNPQSSEEWLKLRKSAIGGSDIPAVMGYSQYKTRARLLLEKKNGIDTSLSEYVQEQAAQREAEARYRLGNILKLDLQPMCVQKIGERAFIATLDGYNEKEQVLMEHKCSNMDEFGYDLPENDKTRAWRSQVAWQVGTLDGLVKKAYITVSPLNTVNGMKVYPLNVKELIDDYGSYLVPAAKQFMKEWRREFKKELGAV